MTVDDKRPLRIKVLGPLEIEGPEGPIRLAGRKQRSLLAALLDGTAGSELLDAA